MKFTSTLATAIMALVSFTQAHPLTNMTLTDADVPSSNVSERGIVSLGWATFCNDKECLEGCGKRVALNDPGCLNELNRGSVFFDIIDGVHLGWSMVYSPGEDCPCQAECHRVPQWSKCVNISHLKQYKSWRFQANRCAKDNCHA